MKMIKFLFITTLSVAMFSCTKDDNNPDAPKPTLTVTELGTGAIDQDLTVAPGAMLSFKWNALRTGGGSVLESFEIFQNGSNVTVPLPKTSNGETLPITNLPNKYESQYVDTIMFSAGSNLGITTYTFSLTDKDGSLVERVINVTVANPTTPLAMEKTGEIYHVGGSLKGSWDLVADLAKGASDPAADKDIRNKDIAGDPFTGSFNNTNNTMFVKSNSFDYMNATEESAMAAYAAGTPSATVTNPAVGDMYIAKIRGGNTYMVIKIATIDAADNTCNCGNKGKMTFTYKKN